MQVVKHSERDAEKLLVSKIKNWAAGPINLRHPAAPGYPTGLLFSREGT